MPTRDEMETQAALRRLPGEVEKLRGDVTTEVHNLTAAVEAAVAELTTLNGHLEDIAGRLASIEFTVQHGGEESSDPG